MCYSLWLKSQRGQNLVEYAMFITLAVVIAVAGIGAVGVSIQDMWTGLGSWLSASVETLP